MQGKKGLARVRRRPRTHEQQHFSPIVSNNGLFDQAFGAPAHTSARQQASMRIFVSQANTSLSVCMFVCVRCPRCRLEWRLYSCCVMA